MNLDSIFNLIIVVINLILISFIFIQIRDSRKPLILTGIISKNKEATDQPSVLESGELYVIVTNDSENVAKSIDINYEFVFDDKVVDANKDQNKLDYLNPGEAVRILLKTKPIQEKYPDIFEAVTLGNITKTIPKETLKINLSLKVEYNPIIGNLDKHKIEDTYFIEWLSRKSVPDFEYHPLFNCWNVRNDALYIHKTKNSVQNLKLCIEEGNDNVEEF
jgi:hypothetical protein